MDDKNNGVVVVTGASRGLGRAVVEFFTNEGYVVAAAARSEKELEEAQRNNMMGWRSIVVPADVTKSEDVEKLAATAIKEYGTIDVWVNNAGVLYRADVDQIADDELRRCFETNVYGTFYGCREAAKIMKQNKSGHIINIVSTSALIGRSNESVYCATKWAVRGLHESLKQELNQYNIRVTAAYLGGMRTDLFKQYNQNVDHFMDPAEVAKIIVGLAQTPPEIAPTEITIQRQKSVRA